MPGAIDYSTQTTFGLHWQGFRRAVCYTVAASCHIKQVIVALKVAEYTFYNKVSTVDNEHLLWELREGTANSAAGLAASTLITAGTWLLNDRSLWPAWSVRYKTATFFEPILHDETKFYFLVLRTQNESTSGLWYIFWLGEQSSTRVGYAYNETAGWQAHSWIHPWIGIPTDQAGVKYQAVINGTGFMTPDNLASYNKQLATQFGGTLRGGQSRHSQLSYPYSSFSQDTFRHGMGWTYFEDPQTFYFGNNIDARVEGQVILAPYAVTAPLEGIVTYHIADSRLDLGLPWERYANPDKPVLQIAQQVRVSSSNYTVKSVWLWLRKEWLETHLSASLTFKLCEASIAYPAAWVTATAYVLGNYVRPTTVSKYYYECTTAGTSGATEPLWPTVPGNTITDGSVVWTCRLSTPGAALRTVSVEGQNTLDWNDMCLVEISFAEWGTLPIDQYLWLVLECGSTGANDAPIWSVAVDPTASYSQSGYVTMFMYYYEGAWVEDTGYDMQFFINMGAFPVGECHFAEFKNALYVSGGPSIYWWDETNKVWKVKVDGSLYGGDCTSLAVFADKLWAAWGEAHVVRWSSDGITWNDVLTQYANLFFVGMGYLWKSNPAAASKNLCYYSNDGTTWSAAISIGESTTKITGFCVFNDVLVASKENGLWYVDRDYLAHIYFDYQDQKYEKNGTNLKVWSNNIYIPILSGLWRWTGSSVDTLGPDRRAGLPKHWEGRIVDIISCANWMFVAVGDGGSTAWPQVLCYNGVGWLPFLRGRRLGAGLRRIFLTSTIGNELRLWVMEDKSCYYVSLPYTRENHYEWDGAKYEPDGTLVTSWWNGGLFNAIKYFKDITLEVDGLEDDGNTKSYVDVWYQIDGDENLLGTSPPYYLGRVTKNGTNTLKFNQDLVAYSIRFIFKLTSTIASLTPRLKSYNVDCIVRPDPTFVTSFAVSLADNIKLMDNSESPYTADELWEQLVVAQAQGAPIIISLPFQTIYGFISALQTRTRQYKEHGAIPKWEQTAVISIVEA